MKKFLITFFLILCFVPLALVNGNTNTSMEAKVYSSSNTVTKRFSYDNDLELFINNSFEISFTKEGDNEFFFYALEFSETNKVIFQKNDNIYSSGLITVSKAGVFTILIQSSTTEEYYTIDLIVYDRINSLVISIDDPFPLINEELRINILYNNSPTVLLDSQLTWHENGSVLDSTLLAQNNSTYILLNPFSSERKLALSASYGDIISNTLDITISDLEIASSFNVLDNSKVFLKSDEYGYIKALVPKDSKPTIRILDDTFSVRYDSFVKEAYNETNDLVVIKLEFIRVNKFTLTVICDGVIDGTPTSFAKNVDCEIIDSLDSFIIGVNKEEIGLGEHATFTASVNGSDLLDTNITWFVDNEEISVNDYSFDYNFGSGGDHYVYAMINGIKSNELSIFVNYTKVEMLIWYSLLGFALCFGIPALIFINKKHGNSRIKVINNRLKDYNIVLKNLEKKYKKTKKKDEVEFNYKKMINKLSTLYNEADYESHLHKEAVYDDLKKNIDKSKRILEVIVKLYREKTNREIAKLINDTNTYVARGLDNIENINQIEKAVKAAQAKHKK